MRVTPWQLLAGITLDWVFGDPAWLPHPVRGLGRVAMVAEQFWRASRLPLRAAGVMFWLTVVAFAGAMVWLTLPWAAVYWIYALLACRDLDVEAARVVRALDRNDIAEARRELACIVGRDTAQLGEREIMRAVVETVAESLNDGVIAPLFYLATAGPVGMAVYKSINTLDSMVGYRDERYREFGWASARMDDLANFLPARITAMLIWIAALLPGYSVRRSMAITIRDARSQPSPNSGYPEAAAAGALGVQLGGLNFYRGVASRKAFLGDAIHPLHRGDFARIRTLLYACEGLFVAAAIGVSVWL